MLDFCYVLFFDSITTEGYNDDIRKIMNQSEKTILNSPSKEGAFLI
jgi:hypothetical protein